MENSGLGVLFIKWVWNVNLFNNISYFEFEYAYSIFIFLSVVVGSTFDNDNITIKLSEILFHFL